MENTEKTFEILTQHGLCESRQAFEKMRRIAEGAWRIVQDRKLSHLLLLDSLARSQDWVTYCNYATSLVLRYYDKAPWAWAAISYGLRRQGHANEATGIAKLNVMLCPDAVEARMEMCRAVALEANFVLANKYRAEIVRESEVLAKALEIDPDFEGLRQWMLRDG